MLKSLLVSSLVLNFGLLLGRLSGFAREAFVAASYGATVDADIVILMLTVPDMLVNILMGGALGAVLIPEFAQKRHQAKLLLRQSFCLLGGVFSIIAAGLYFYADLLVGVLAPGFEGEQLHKAALSLGWVIWLVPLTVLSGIVTAYLHSENRFVVPSLGTLIVNSSIIAGLYLIYLGYGDLYLLSLFVLFGGLLRLLSQVMQVRPFEVGDGLFPNLIRKDMVVRYVQVMVSGCALLLFPVVARAMASYQGEGNIAILNYSIRLIELPLAIAVTFLSAVFFPRLSKSYADSDVQHRQLIKYGIQVVMVLSVVAAVALVLVSDDYVQFVYGYGAMRDEDLKSVEALLSLGLIALPFQGLSSFLSAVYNSRKNTSTPLAINALGLLLYVIGIKAEFWGGGLEGLVLGLVICYGIVCLLLLSLLKISAFSWRHVFLDKNYILGVSVGMAILVFSGSTVAQADLVPWLSLALSMFAAIVAVISIAAFNKDLRAVVKLRLISK